MAKKPSEAEIKRMEKRINKLEKELEATSPTKSSGFNWKPPVVVISVILAVVLFVLGAMSFAVNRTVTNTDAYLRAIGPVIDQPEVQAAIVQKATQEIQKNINIEEEVSNALPPRASFLAGPIADQINSHIDDFLTKAVASPQFRKVWVATNRQVQTSTIDFIKNSDGNPKLDVATLYTFLSNELQDTPLKVVANKQLPSKVGQIEVTNVSWIPAAHQTLAALPWIQNVGLALSVVFGGLAVWLSQRRRRTGVSLALGTVVGLAIVVGAMAIGRYFALQPITDPVYNSAANAIWTTVLGPLNAYIATLMTLGVLAAIVTWITGSGVNALKIKSGFTMAFTAIHGFIFRGHDKGTFFVNLRKYKTVLYWLVLVVNIGLFVFVFRPLFVSTVLTSTAISLVICGLVQIVASKSK